MAGGKEAERRLLKLSVNQFGLVTAEQCLKHGISRRVQHKRVRTGSWRRIHPGVFKIGTGAPTEAERELAALFYLGDDAVLSHFSAGRRHGLDLPSSSRIQLLVPAEQRVRAPTGIRVWRSRRLDAEEVVRRGPFRMTTVIRTLQDLAPVLDDRWLRAAVDSAMRDQRLQAAEIRAILDDDRRGCAGARRLAKLLQEYDEGQETTDSVLESFAIALNRQCGLAPALHHRIGITDALTFEVDLAWPEHRLCVELDGWKVHGRRSAFGRDRARDRKLVAAGWTVLRYTWNEVTDDGNKVATELSRFLNHPGRGAGDRPFRSSGKPRTPAHSAGDV